MVEFKKPSRAARLAAVAEADYRLRSSLDDDSDEAVVAVPEEEFQARLKEVAGE